MFFVWASTAINALNLLVPWPGPWVWWHSAADIFNLSCTIGGTALITHLRLSTTTVG